MTLTAHNTEHIYVSFSVAAIFNTVLIAVALAPRLDLPPRLRLESCQSEQINRIQTDLWLSRNSRLALHNLHLVGGRRIDVDDIITCRNSIIPRVIREIIPRVIREIGITPIFRFHIEFPKIRLNFQRSCITDANYKI